MPQLHRISNIIAHAASVSYTPRQVAKAYNAPIDTYDGTGQTIGIIELGGAYNAADLKAYAAKLDVPAANVAVVNVGNGRPVSDGPKGADGEVMLDVEVVAAVAPGVHQRLYLCENTNAGFLAGIKQAVVECGIVSISWGGAESSWDAATMDEYEQVLAAARAKGVAVFVASGDTGSRDSTSTNTVDFPASSPSVIACGGTQLRLSDDGSRASEVTWDDDDTQSATGGGVSKHFPGRQVPDLAGNASPTTGYQIRVDGGTYVIGGTSAVAPLYAAMTAIMRQASGASFDLLNLVLTNPTIAFDVTIGDNGGYKAGPGRDMTTGYGVLDVARALAVLTSGTQVPAPGGNPAPTPTPTPAPEPVQPIPAPPVTANPLDGFPFADYRAFEAHPYSLSKRRIFIARVNAWILARD